MADLRDPTEVEQVTLALVKLWHVVNGLYLWEFVTTLDYEWSIIRRRRPYRWTIWIYSLARVASIIGVILSFVGMDVDTPIDCQLWVTSELIFSYLSAAAASLLIVLRVIAIWNKNKAIKVAAYSIWGINVAFLIQAIVRLESTWTAAQDGCVVLNSETGVPTLISIVVTDFALLLIMLVGLLRSCRHGDGMIGLTRFLWKQGVIWLLIAAVAEVPPVVLIILDLNDPFNLMLQIPSLITMTIAATRMHRYLVDFATGPSYAVHEDPPIFGLTASKTNRTRTSSSCNPMVVAVYKEFEQHPTLQTSDQGPARTSTDKQVHEKPDKLSLDNDVERGM